MNHSLNPVEPVKNKKTYLFYANVKTKGKIWSRSIENSYSKKLLQSYNAKLAVDELVNQEKSGNIENIDVLGVYYKGDDSAVVSKLKIENFTENSGRVDFDFINLEETPITTGALSKIIGEDYGYYLDGENQFIICFAENIDELLKRSQK